MDTLAARQQMVDQQIRTWEVLDPRVLDALSQVPREAFVPAVIANSRLRMRRFPSDSVSPCSPRSCRAASCRRLASMRRTARSRWAPGTGYLSACLSLLGSIDALHRYSSPISPPPQPPICARCRRHACSSRRAMRSVRAPSGEYDVIAVTGSLPVYDTRFERALRVGGRLFAVVGVAPVMDAVLVRRVDQHRMDSRESVRDCDRPSSSMPQPAGVCVLMVKDLSSAGIPGAPSGRHDDDLAGRARRLGSPAGAGARATLVHIPMGQIAERLSRARSIEGDGGDLPFRRAEHAGGAFSEAARIRLAFSIWPAGSWLGPATWIPRIPQY